jgi:hypothetical protein
MSRMRQLRNRWLLVVLPAVIVAASSLTAAAQGFSLAPGSVDLIFTPGEPVAFDLDFSNGSPNPISMRATVTDWGFDEKGQKIFPPAGTLPRSAATWVELVPQEFVTGAGAGGKIRIVITPPPKASGGYYCVVFAESTPALSKEASSKESAVYTNFRLGTLVMLTADKTQQFNLIVAPPKLTLPTASKPLTVDLALDNKSNTHVFPRAEMAVLGVDRKLIAHVASNPTRLLPEQKGSLSLTWSGEIPPGNYTALITVIYGDNKLNTQEVPFTIGGEQ